ncbi:MAG TPA: ABC transporter permease [Chitinophagaceae bacterium]|jgi:ABC-type transport system involved in multi-copper enzyme maturation permease subunit|nr:ABC transporter permease [Chitinophagaceae bacterium]
MKTLLLLEWMKVRKYRAFWVFLILFIVAIVGINGALYSIQSHLQTAAHGQAHLDLFDPPQLWSTTAWASGFSVLLLGLLLIVLITNEYTYRTRRQQVIDGLSRKQFIMGKWLVAACFLLFSWLVYIAVTLVLGTTASAGGDLMEGFGYAGYFLLKVALSLSVAFMFAIWLKRAGLAIALYLVYVLLLESIIGYLLNLMIAGMGFFLPLAAGGKLVSNPVSRVMPEMDHSGISAISLVITCLIYLIVFIYLSLLYIRRADL